jgi:cytoskeletal protein CcmA (bactofilin family)
MAYSDELKSLRKKEYGEGAVKKSEDLNSTPRIIVLTDEERKVLGDVAPGSDLSCEVKGTLDSDGRFNVMSIGPIGGEVETEEDSMAGSVAQKVTPTIQPSPS